MEEAKRFLSCSRVLAFSSLSQGISVGACDVKEGGKKQGDKKDQ